MNDVNELANALRGESECYCTGSETYEVLREASKALTTLQAENKSLRNDRDQWKLAAESSRDGIQPMLRKRIEELTAQRDAAIEDLYSACKGAPCNNGICVKKNCTGNVIPCDFEWRGTKESIK